VKERGDFSKRLKANNGSLSVYPIFGLFDIGNIQSKTPSIKVSVNGECKSKGVYANTPEVMGLKLYSKAHNIFRSTSTKYPYDGINVGGKSIIHNKGMNTGGTERDLREEMEKWYLENERVREMLKTCSQRGCGVRMEMTCFLSNAGEVLELLKGWVEAAGYKRGEDQPHDRLIVSYPPSQCSSFVLEKFEDLVTFQDLQLNNFLEEGNLGCLPEIALVDYILKEVFFKGSYSRLPKEVILEWMETNWLKCCSSSRDGSFSSLVRSSLLEDVFKNLIFQAGGKRGAVSFNEYLKLEEGERYLMLVKERYEDGPRSSLDADVARKLQLLKILSYYYDSLSSNLSRNRPLLPENRGWKSSMRFWSQGRISQIIVASNLEMERMKGNGEIAPRWKSSTFQEMELEMGAEEIPHLFDVDMREFWKKFAFFTLFQKLCGEEEFAEVGKIGSRRKYMRCFGELLWDGNLVFHLPHPTRFHHNASSLRFLNEGDLPVGWRRLAERDLPPACLRDVHHFFLDDDELSSSEEEEKLREWGTGDSAKLLHIIDDMGKGKRWKHIKIIHFSDVDIKWEGIRQRYLKLKKWQAAYKNDRFSFFGRKFGRIKDEYYALQEEEEEEEEDRPLKRQRSQK